jgi:glutamate---cysteine ligase / carboxylate-amine ligase
MYHPSFNIGIEEEYQVIDPESRELLGYVTQSMANEQMVVRERNPDADLAQRFSEAVIQVGTPVCADIKEAREKLVRMRENVLELVQESGAKVVAAGTHPFSHWENRPTILPGYRAMVDDAQMIVRRLLCFGLRVHIGVEDRELAVDVMNTMRYLLPHILCLATSSPFWVGRNTGLKSYRNVLLDALPRTGIPGYFSNYQEYRGYIDTLIRTNSMPDASQVRYDIMPHYRFPTLVIRICDMLPEIRSTLAVTALIQATVAWMVDLRQRNMQFRPYERLLIAENKWRAVRYGLDGKLLDLGLQQALPAGELIRELLERVGPYARRLNSEDELTNVEAILLGGASADRQLQVWHEQGHSAKAVVDDLARLTEQL